MYLKIKDWLKNKNHIKIMILVLILFLIVFLISFNCYMDKKKIEQKEGNYQRSTAYFNVGNFFFHLDYPNPENLRKAVEYFNKAIEANPKNETLGPLYKGLGIAYSNLGEYEKAIEYFNKHLELNPKDTESYFNLGLSFQKLGDYNKAIEYYNKTYELEPDSRLKANIYHGLGWCFLLIGNYERAIEYFGEILKLNMGPIMESKAYNGLGMCYLEKDFNQAADYFAKAIDLLEADSHNKVIALFGLGRCYLKSGNYDKAIESFNKSFEIAPIYLSPYEFRNFSFFLLYYMAESYYKNGDFIQAKNKIDEVLKIIDSASPSQLSALENVKIFGLEEGILEKIFLLKTKIGEKF